MASGSLGTITTHGKVCMVRQRGKEIQRPACLGRIHFGPESFDKVGPGTRRVGIFRLRNELGARRQVGKPDVIPVLRRILGFRNAARRSAHGANPKAFVACAVGSKPDDSQRHRPSLSRTRSAPQFEPLFIRVRLVMAVLGRDCRVRRETDTPRSSRSAKA